VIEAGQLRVITSRLKPQIAEADAIASANRANPFADMAASMVGDQAQERWDVLSVVQRRAVLKAFGVQVFIDRVARKGPGFDPDSVRILPRDDPGR
jgi:site-specific DNA recombinase